LCRVLGATMSNEELINEVSSNGQSNGKSEEGGAKEKAEQREIKGGLPYTTAHGVLKKALDAIITAERPDKFSANYMATVLGLTGGSARQVPPFLKKLHFITGDGSPTQLYSKFKTDGGRSQAAYEGLRTGFAELFKRNEYIHKADENAVKDIIVEVTGLRKADPIVRMIYGSFDAVRGFVSSDVASSNEQSKPDKNADPTVSSQNSDVNVDRLGVGLSYQINIVLPETDNIAVFNSIFKSLKENLLQ
jgi:hypothetical protein